MKVKPLPSRERLDELLIFDEHTGEIRWRCGRRKCKAGDIAGCIVVKRNKPYRQIVIDGIQYFAHRLARFYYYGDQPIEVDHANGNGLDNRKDNLRSSNRDHNQNNAGKRKDNKTGVIGVSYCKRMKLWLAQYGSTEFRKKHGTLILFDDFFEAVCCRKSWECKYGMTEIKKHLKD